MKVYKLLLIVLLIVSCCFSCKTKEVAGNSIKKELNYIPYYLKVYEADSLYVTKNYQESYTILDDLFKEYEPLNLPNYNEVYNYYRLKIILKEEIDKNNFSELISKYNMNNKVLENDSLIHMYYMKEKKIIDKNYAELRQKYKATLNLTLRKEIKEMCLQDQLFRDKDYQNNMTKQNKIDSINSLKTRQIFNDYGYPNEHVVGDFMIDNTNVDIEIVLLHTNDKERIEYYMPKILEYVKKGKLTNLKTYAVLQDQFNLYHGKEQYYGSYENKTSVPIKELNRRRKSIGLPNYEYEKWRFKQLYPNEEY